MKQQSFLKRALAHLKKIGQAWSAAQPGTFGASVAYYTVFSLAPLLVITITIAGFVVQRSEAQTTIIEQFRSTFGETGATLVESLISSKLPTEAGIILPIISFIIILVGATGIFSQLQAGLDTIFESLPEKAKGFWRTVIRKLVSLGMVLSVGFLLIVSLVLSTIITALSGYISQYVGNIEPLVHLVDIVISLLLIGGFMSLMYKLLPTKKIRWKPALVGGLLAAIFFTIGKFLLGLYLGSSAAFNAYGAASALVLIIIWTYYMSQIFFLSAILTRLYVVPKRK
jgi:membrane protein